MLPLFDIVVYHRACLDGFSALTVAYNGGVLKEGNKLWFHAMGADETRPPPNLAPNKKVLILDLNMSYKTVKHIVDNSDEVYLIDHHHHHDHDSIVNLQKKGKFTYIYDKNECGATLTWKWIYPQKPIPRFLELMKDSDLGLWKDPDTQNLVLGLEVRHNTYKGLTREATIEKLERWKRLLVSEERVEKLIKYGKKIKPFQSLILERMEKNTEIVEITNPKTLQKVKVAITNAGVYIGKKLSVRLAKQLKDEVSFAIVWYFNVSRRTIECVVRSNSDNIGWLLRMYNASGHDTAGTFFYDAKDIYTWLSDHENKVRNFKQGGGSIRMFKLAKRTCWSCDE